MFNALEFETVYIKVIYYVVRKLIVISASATAPSGLAANAPHSGAPCVRGREDAQHLNGNCRIIVDARSRVDARS